MSHTVLRPLHGFTLPGAVRRLLFGGKPWDGSSSWHRLPCRAAIAAWLVAHFHGGAPAVRIEPQRGPASGASGRAATSGLDGPPPVPTPTITGLTVTGLLLKLKMRHRWVSYVPCRVFVLPAPSGSTRQKVPGGAARSVPTRSRSAPHPPPWRTNSPRAPAAPVPEPWPTACMLVPRSLGVVLTPSLDFAGIGTTRRPVRV